MIYDQKWKYCTPEALITVGWELGGRVVLGVLVGLPSAYLTGRIQPGEPTLIEALGVVFLCAGLALWLEVSFMITAMVLGATIANQAQHHKRPFRAIENIEWRFMVLFFVLAGASFDMAMAWLAGSVVGVYLLSRILGRVVEGWTGATLANADALTRRWIGVALMPQSGVALGMALGMALVDSHRFPHMQSIVLPTVVAITIFFEIARPVATRVALHRVGDTRETRQQPS